MYTISRQRYGHSKVRSEQACSPNRVNHVFPVSETDLSHNVASKHGRGGGLIVFVPFPRWILPHMRRTHATKPACPCACRGVRSEPCTSRVVYSELCVVACMHNVDSVCGIEPACASAPSGSVRARGSTRYINWRLYPYPRLPLAFCQVLNSSIFRVFRLPQLLRFDFTRQHSSTRLLSARDLLPALYAMVTCLGKAEEGNGRILPWRTLCYPT